MLKIPLAGGGTLEVHNPDLERELLLTHTSEKARQDAFEQAMSTVYRIDGEPDETRPYGGLLTRRLDISPRTAYQLLTDGKLAFTCAGKKNYRISERAVREFLGDLRLTG